MSNPGTTANIYPTLCYDDAPAAIEWLCNAFGFTKRLVVPGPDGTIAHAELSFGPGVIMIGSPNPGQGRVGARSLPAVAQSICVQVDDPDPHYAQAKRCGAAILRELRDEDFGGRGYMAKDCEGNQWYFGTYRPGTHWTA